LKYASWFKDEWTIGNYKSNFSNNHTFSATFFVFSISFLKVSIWVAV
jgi:hypothetical protein